MQAITENNGNVTFVLEHDDGEMLECFEQQPSRNMDHHVLACMLDYFGFLGNARYMPIMPEDIGAMTDAPMFTNDLVYTDAGKTDVTGEIYYYPAYELKNFSEVLRTKGRVTFTKVTH